MIKNNDFTDHKNNFSKDMLYFHGILGIASLLFELDSPTENGLLLNILINIYPSLVQVRTISRINKIMNYKNLKTKLPQKINLSN